MKNRIFLLWLLLVSVIPVVAAPTNNRGTPFYFMVLDQPTRDNEVFLHKAFQKAGNARPAFIVVNGIKSATEPCSDDLFFTRKNLADTVERAVIVSLSADDWVHCRNAAGESTALERLARLKEILFEGEYSLGGAPIKLTRQSLNSRFSAYPENAYWHHGSVLFATLHLPADNNHYIAAAGRNNEFEDRAIANKKWLDMLFRTATRRRDKGIVLFSDSSPFDTNTTEVSRDGYREIRQQLNTLISRYSGRVLFIHGQTGSRTRGIDWRGRLGLFELTPNGTRVEVNPATNVLFRVAPISSKTPGRRKTAKPVSR